MVNSFIFGAIVNVRVLMMKLSCGMLRGED